MCLVYLTVESSWGYILFTVPFVDFPGPGHLVITGQVMLREVLGIDVMGWLRYIIKRLSDEVSDEMPQLLEVLVIETYNLVHPTEKRSGASEKAKKAMGAWRK